MAPTLLPLELELPLEVVAPGVAAGEGDAAAGEGLREGLAAAAG